MGLTDHQYGIVKDADNEPMIFIRKETAIKEASVIARGGYNVQVHEFRRRGELKGYAVYAQRVIKTTFTN